MKATLILVMLFTASVVQSQSLTNILSDDIKKIQSMLDKAKKQSSDSQARLQSLMSRLEEINEQLKANEQTSFLDPGPFGPPFIGKVNIPSSLPSGNYVIKG